MFSVLCCSDLYGEKVNLEIALPAFPASLVELEDSLYHAFQSESAALSRGRDGPLPFRIAAIQWYDDERLQWAELLSLDQLHEYDQLYIFQPQTRFHRDVQQDLPPPRLPLGRPAHGSASVTPLPRYASGAQQGASPPVSSRGGGRAADVSRTFHSTGHAGDTRDSAELSPSARKLMERSREESGLVERLRQLRDEKIALERSVELEVEEERRQLAAQTDAALRQKEEQIWQQRDKLAQAEHDFQALLERKQQLLSTHSSRSV